MEAFPQLRLSPPLMSLACVTLTHKTSHYNYQENFELKANLLLQVAALSQGGMEVRKKKKEKTL